MGPPQGGRVGQGVVRNSAGMHLVVYNHFTVPTAEREIAQRILIAAGRLGWRASTAATPAEVERAGPDLVLMTHFDVPKVCDVPTYACVWNPPSFFRFRADLAANVLSCDGFLTASAAIEEWVRGAVRGRPCRIAPFYTSCHATEFVPPAAASARLMYCGFNWDGPRRADLFARLDEADLLDVYGPAERWAHIRRGRRGLLPLDGTSVPAALRAAGAGLCLHTSSHLASGTASMRVFETVAAGAVVICDDHSFVREHFGDTVQMVDVSGDVGAVFERMRDRLHAVRSHPRRAEEMARAAHDIFLRKFSFEVLLSQVAQRHSEWCARSVPVVVDEPPAVEIIVPDVRAHPDARRATLNSIAAQTYPRVEVSAEGASSNGSCRTGLGDRLGALRGDLFAVVPPGVRLHRRHIAVLVDVLQRRPEAAFAHSAAIAPRTGAWGRPGIVGFGPVDAGRLRAGLPCVPRGGWLGRTRLLGLLRPGDFDADGAADEVLLLRLMGGGPAVFSFQVTLDRLGTPTDARPEAELERRRLDGPADRRRVFRLYDGSLPETYGDGLLGDVAGLWREGDAAFVRSALRRMLRGEPDEAEVRRHAARLEAGEERSRWLRSMAEEAGLEPADAWNTLLARLPRASACGRFAILRSLWKRPDREFADGAHRLLTGAPPAENRLDLDLALLADGCSRAELVQQLALSRAGRAHCGRLPWLGRLAALEREHGGRLSAAAAVRLGLERTFRLVAELFRGVRL